LEGLVIKGWLVLTHLSARFVPVYLKGQQETTSSTQLEIDPVKVDGKRRRKSSFPDEAIITFK